MPKFFVSWLILEIIFFEPWSQRIPKLKKKIFLVFPVLRKGWTAAEELSNIIRGPITFMKLYFSDLIIVYMSMCSHVYLGVFCMCLEIRD